MSNRSSMLNLSQEVLLLIFVQFYAAATIDFRNGVVLGLTGFYLYGRQDRRRHHAPDTLSWVPEQLIPPLLICKYLRPIAWEAFLNTTQFVIAGEQMTRRTPMRRHSWLDIKLAKDPTDLARRLHCDLEFANLLCEHWDSSKNLLPSLKELTVTEKTEIKLPFDNSYNPLHSVHNLREDCSEKGIKLNVYLTLVGHRIYNGRAYAQTIRFVVRDHGSISIKEVKATDKASYDSFRQFWKDEYELELKAMECKRGRKFIKYLDEELDWQEKA